VLGVDIVAKAIEDAKANAKCNGIENAKFFAGHFSQNSSFLFRGSPQVLRKS
jgi:tRNA/tmRNA/rRNA uracil-C5-methylase (TrmA/RlmC/RlmD family)